MACMSESVTSNLPAILIARNRPLSISVRRDLAVILPSGKCRRAASAKLNRGSLMM